MQSVTVAAAATSILSNALNALKAVRERAQSSKGHDLKEQISILYDVLLTLKEAVMLVTDENNELKQKIAQLERLRKSLSPSCGKSAPLITTLWGIKDRIANRAMTETAN